MLRSYYTLYCALYEPQITLIISTYIIFLFSIVSSRQFHTHQFSFEASERMKAIGLIANFDLRHMTVDSIEKATEDIIKKYEEAYDSIGQVSTTYILL